MLSFSASNEATVLRSKSLLSSLSFFFSPFCPSDSYRFFRADLKWQYTFFFFLTGPASSSDSVVLVLAIAICTLHWVWVCRVHEPCTQRLCIYYVHVHVPRSLFNPHKVGFILYRFSEHRDTGWSKPNREDPAEIGILGQSDIVYSEHWS